MLLLRLEKVLASVHELGRCIIVTVELFRTTLVAQWDSLPWWCFLLLSDALCPVVRVLASAIDLFNIITIVAIGVLSLALHSDDILSVVALALEL